MLQAHAVRLFLSVFALSAILLSYPARAEVEVMSSTVAGLNVGTKLPDDATLEVGEGEVLRLMRSGTTYEISGPYRGTLDQYSKGCSGTEILSGTCGGQPAEDRGATPGATRGIIPQ
jgi:hypothetical protein